jgi:hypothetical protein
MQNNSKEQYLQTVFSGKKFYRFYSLPKLAEANSVELEELPYSIRILMESCLRHQSDNGYHPEQLQWLLKWQPQTEKERPALAFLPARILMQDFTGLPVVNDFSALRAYLKRNGKDPEIANPRIPADLVIDHSLTVEASGCPEAQRINEEREFQLNLERYRFLKWSQKAFRNLRVLPPGLGICHQVNLEYLGRVVFVEERDGDLLAYPDSVMGTDSHTTMINGLGVAAGAWAASKHWPPCWAIPANSHPGRDRPGIDRRAARSGQPDRPDPDDHQQAARDRRGWKIRGVVRRGLRRSAGGNPRHDRQYVPGIRRYYDLLPGRHTNAALSGTQRTPLRPDRSGGNLFPGTGIVP